MFAGKRIQLIVQFFETFDEFKGRAFHMAGESYGVGPSTIG
jgi:hypothetical protein